jgi:homoserine O-acetyltransferase/O-succinyltransferase
MIVMRIVVALVAVAASTQVSWAQSPVQTCQLGALQLESGQSIPNFRMTYITFGRLNAARSNAVLQIHGLRGTRDSQTSWAGPRKAFDTAGAVLRPRPLKAFEAAPSIRASRLLLPFVSTCQ